MLCRVALVFRLTSFQPLQEFPSQSTSDSSQGSIQRDRTPARHQRPTNSTDMSDSSTQAVADASTVDAKLDPRVARALAVNDLVAQHPVAEAAHIRPYANGHAGINIQWATTSHKTHWKKLYNQTFVIDEKGDKIYESQLQAISEEVKVSTRSAFGEWTVNFRETNVHDKKKRIVEIINEQSGVYGELDVTKLHGSILEGSHWGRPSWLSEKDNILVYTAEQHPPHWDQDDKRKHRLEVIG